MCATCEEIERILDNTELSSVEKTERALQSIESELFSGGSYEHFKEILDRVLGTQNNQHSEPTD